MEGALDRLREIAEALDHAGAEHASTLLLEANQLIALQIVEHERGDEFDVYPRVAKFLADRHGLGG